MATGKAEDFVTLVSSDEHEFVVSKACAHASGTIKAMLAGPGEFDESETGEIGFREIKSDILERVCIYLYYKKRFESASSEIPEFPISKDMVLELLMAANFLDA
eukprot:m.11398 g.11398  ORF g.11398 m.11398 type:complete len:104 (+) comp5717_c0_seq1:44-355(+)